MFCEVCLNILQDGQAKLERLTYTPYDDEYRCRQHTSAASFKNSVDQGCQICVALWASIERQLQDKTPDEPEPRASLENVCDFTGTQIRFTFLYDHGDVLFLLRLEVVSEVELWSHFDLLSHKLLPNSVLPDSAMAKPLQGDTTGSPEAIMTALSWTRKCDDTHGQCRPRDAVGAWYPSRLLDVGNASTATVRLLTSCDEHLSGPYTTLSHCWGSATERQPMKLLHTTKTTLTDGKELHQLPRTFQDAVVITRSLGIAYLWIDSLCIQQDCPQDWETESLLMDKVYSNSYLNLSADCGTDSSSGLLRNRDPFVDSRTSLKLNTNFLQLISKSATRPAPAASNGVTPSPPPVMEPRTQASSPEHHVDLSLPVSQWPKLSTSFGQSPPLSPHPEHIACQLLELKYWDLNVTAAPINNRGWVFQERYLSPRVLHFGQKQLFWECRQSCFSEAYPTLSEVIGAEGFSSMLDRTQAVKETYQDSNSHTNLRDRPPGLDESSAFWHDSWCSLVELYSKTVVSFPKDKLIAISGIAKFFAEAPRLSNDRYLAGLWQQDLRYQLLWMALPIAEKAGRQTRRAAPYRAPSWSWAAVDAELFFLCSSHSGSKFTFIDAQLTHTSNDITGPVTGGYLELSGYLGSLTLLHKPVGLEGEALFHVAIGTESEEKAQCDSKSADLGKGLIKDLAIAWDAPQDDFPRGFEDQEYELFVLVANLKERSWDPGRFSFFTLVLEQVPEDVGSFRRVGISYDPEFSQEDTTQLFDAVARGGASLPCREYKDGLHTIRIY